MKPYIIQEYSNKVNAATMERRQGVRKIKEGKDDRRRSSKGEGKKEQTEKQKRRENKEWKGKIGREVKLD